MKMIMTIFRKELLDSLRDRRTLVTMVVVPLLLFPLLIGISSRVTMSQIKKAQEKVLRVGVLATQTPLNFRSMLAGREDIRIIDLPTLDEGTALVQSDSLDAFIAFDPAFERAVTELRSGGVTHVFKAAERREIETDRVRKIIDAYAATLREARFKRMNLDASIINTLNVNEQNLASPKERIAEVIGGFLPYLFIIFCYLGAIYPAIDLAAGEKERGTLETLLTAPVGRMQILLGKFGVVTLTGILSAGVSIFGLYIGIQQVREIPPELFQTIMSILELKSIVLLISLLIPLTVFFAAGLLSLSIYARSFKEAQSLISPLMIVVIVPAFLGLLPGMTLTEVTALIPILNISLATKGIIAETASPWLIAEVFVSMIALAALSLYLCSKIFGRESIVFR